MHPDSSFSGPVVGGPADGKHYLSREPRLRVQVRRPISSALLPPDVPEQTPTGHMIDRFEYVYWPHDARWNGYWVPADWKDDRIVAELVARGLR